MSEREIDEISGVETTGHEWDGIKELNNPLPRWWLWTFYGCIAVGLVISVLYPAWPLFGSATPGILGYSTRAERQPRPAGVAAGRQDRRRSHPVAVCRGGRRLGLQGLLHPVPRHRRGRRGRLSQPQR
jgi:hypothetical protein